VIHQFSTLGLATQEILIRLPFDIDCKPTSMFVFGGKNQQAFNRLLLWYQNITTY